MEVTGRKQKSKQMFGLIGRYRTVNNKVSEGLTAHYHKYGHATNRRVNECVVRNEDTGTDQKSKQMCKLIGSYRYKTKRASKCVNWMEVTGTHQKSLPHICTIYYNNFKFDFSKIKWREVHRALPQTPRRFFSGFAIGSDFALNSQPNRVFPSTFDWRTWFGPQKLIPGPATDGIQCYPITAIKNCMVELNS